MKPTGADSCMILVYCCSRRDAQYHVTLKTWCNGPFDRLWQLVIGTSVRWTTCCRCQTQNNIANRRFIPPFGTCRGDTRLTLDGYNLVNLELLIARDHCISTGDAWERVIAATVGYQPTNCIQSGAPISVKRTGFLTFTWTSVYFYVEKTAQRPVAVDCRQIQMCPTPHSPPRYQSARWAAQHLGMLSRCYPTRARLAACCHAICTAARTLLSFYSLYSLRMRVGRSQTSCYPERFNVLLEQ